MVPFDTYKTYISIKNHFTNKKYDYHKYAGKNKASLESFYKRKDRYWFEKLSRQKEDKDVINFFVANFVSSTDPGQLWMGNLIKEGEKTYVEWKRKIESLSYVFKQESIDLFSEYKFQDVFSCKNGSHPIVLKKFLSGKISLETMVIYDRIFSYSKNFDKQLKDPIWEMVSLKLNKYSSFLNIDVFHYKKILKEIVIGGK
jgi:hypothetical protein